MFSRLQYISQGVTAQEQINNISSTLDAGCEWVQLRFKNANLKEFEKVAVQVKQLADVYKATLIINDHAEIAKNIDASGLHLGLQDLTISEARNILGPEKIIGGTANTLQDALKRVEEGCNYIGLGPFRFTTGKDKLSPVLGEVGIRKILNELNRLGAKTPVYAIGGILPSDMEEIMETSVYGLAVSGAITRHSNKKEILQKFNQLLNGKYNNC